MILLRCCLIYKLTIVYCYYLNQGIVHQRHKASQHRGRLERLVLFEHGKSSTSLEVRKKSEISRRTLDRISRVLRSR
jgi:hypothetical protein